MSSTRHKQPGDESMYQERFASSPEFERGLLASSVAKRCSLVDDPSDRELVWFVHYLSHRPGSLSSFAVELLAKYQDRIGTTTMLALRKSPEDNYNADEVRKIRVELPRRSCRQFPLKGESKLDLARAARDSNAIMVCKLGGISDDEWQREQRQRREQEDADAQPQSYPVQDFLTLCHNAATDDALRCELENLCIDPGWDLSAGGPWYFPRLVDTLREYQAALIKARADTFVSTSLSKKIFETLDYAFYSRRLTVMEGEARRGKSFAARSWCEQHPGQARFVEVPPSNDEISFLRSISRGLGLGNYLNYKAAELRARVESVLLTGNLALVLDEAHRLWPQRYQRYATPTRIEWIMSMANAGVPIALLSTPQFIQSQKTAEKAGWNSAQFIGRIFYQSLPADLSAKDLMAVAKFALPQADETTLKAVAIYARSSATYVAAIEAISTRAGWIAKQAGRSEVTTEDVRRAMQESVIPSDTKLKRVLAAGKKASMAMESIIPDPDIIVPDTLDLPASRTLAPAARRGNIVQVPPP